MQRFGDFALLERLGQGSGGTAHLARRIGADDKNDHLLVIKRLHANLMDRDTFVRRFSHEALIAVSVDSPNVVVVEDVGRVGDEPYIAMHYVSGLSLHEVLKRVSEARYEVPLEVVVAIIAGCLTGLRALHDAIHPDTLEPLGVVHRDVSPNNLVLAFDGRPVLIDLGLGKSNVADWQTHAGDVLGSLGYMAPEQVLGGRVDHRADLFALSAVFYELLTLEPYVPRGSRREMMRRMEVPRPVAVTKLRPDVPSAIERLVADGLSFDPGVRPANAAEMCDRLTAAIPPASQALVAAFVRDLVGDAENESLRHVRSLLDRAIAFPDDTPYTGTVVIARRESSIRTLDEIDSEQEDPTALLVAHERPKIHRVADVEPKETIDPIDSDTILHTDTRITEVKRGAPWSLVIALMLLVALVTVLVDRLVIGGFEAAPPPTEPPPEISVTPR